MAIHAVKNDIHFDSHFASKKYAGLRREKLSQSDGHQRVTAFTPRAQAALQWPDAPNPLFP
jgi:hypothetical protein